MFSHILRGVAVAGLVLAATLPSSAGSPTEAGMPICQPAGAGGHQICTLPLNKSLIIDLPRDARDVLVSNPAIANVVVRTARRVYLTGVWVGQTNVFVFDANGDTIVSLDIQVERDISGLAETLRRLIPGSNITVEMINDNIILSGTVQNAADARRADEIAGVFANAGAAGTLDPTGTTIVGAGDDGPERLSSVINLISIEGDEQVMLKVTVAEMERNTVKQLGIDWTLDNLTVGGLLFQSTGGAAYPANGVPPNHGLFGGIPQGEGGIGIRVEALEQAGLSRTLAEPTLVAISGETARFQAGGEFPVPVAGTGTQVTVEYKQFGIMLEFTPVVLSEGRISLHIATEVSELTNEGAITGGGLTLPGLTVRRVETTLELPSGGAMVMSGLIQDSVREAISGLPGVRQIPILGALFGSRDYVRQETELVVIVTPYLVNPVAPSALARPDDGFHPAGDLGAALFGQLNLRYGTQGQAATGAYQGNPGFIIP